MNTNNNFLVLWNPLNDSEEKILKQFLNKFLMQNDSEKLIKWKFVFSEGQLEKELSESNFSHIIVLCELTWSGKKFSDFYGIELVQKQIRVKHNNHKPINLPILFVSFCTREQIVKMDQTKEIINTYGLGNHFIQLPKASETEISDLWKMKPATELEMIDTLHFCAYDKMIASIRHGVSTQSLVHLKHKIIDIISKIDKQLKLDEIKNQFISCESKENFKQLCDNLESKLSSQLLKTSDLVDKGKFKVLLIDDEKTDSVILLQEEAKDYLIIEHVNNTETALKILKDDYNNEYQVVICDYRIYDNPLHNTKQTMLYPQGYTFIEQAAILGHLYKFISFSGLPRAFRIAVAEKLNIRIETVDKELMTSTENGRKSFINKIIDLAEENKDHISAIASDNYYFRTLYKRTITEKISIEDEVCKEAITLINMLNYCLNIDEKRTINNILSEEADNLIQSQNFNFNIKENEILYKQNNLFAQYWKDIKSKFSLQSDTKSQKPDNKFYFDELKVLIDAVKSEIKKSIKASDYVESEFDKLVLKTINDNGKLTNVNNIYYALNEKGKEIFKNVILSENEKTATNNANKIYNKLKGNDEIYQFLISNCKNITLAFKDPYTDEAMKKFVGKLIVRRFAVYCYYWLDENIDTTKVSDIKGLTHAVNRLLIKGYLGKEGGTDSGITTNNLFLSVKDVKIKAISELQHIALTIEEQNFFRINYPDLYEKWNK